MRQKNKRREIEWIEIGNDGENWLDSKQLTDGIEWIEIIK